MSFDIASVLSQAAGRDTGINNGREKIELIPYQQIIANSENFYSMEGIDELAANIELIGLQQPVRVRWVSREAPFGPRYCLVSGHRRLAAWKKLDLSCPEETYRKIPAIIEPERTEPYALQQLRLIFANSDTRKMSGRDLQRQAQETRKLLEKLKGDGYEFKGRMRDQVAKICGVSKSKLSRLDAIENNLHEGIKNAFYSTGKIGETVAYEISRLPKADQSEVCRKLVKGWEPTAEDVTKFAEIRSAKKTADRELKELHDQICDDFEQLTSAAESVPETGTQAGSSSAPAGSASGRQIWDPEWLTGIPNRNRGPYYCKIRIGDVILRQVLDYRELNGEARWNMSNGYAIDNECEVVAWWPLPEG